MPSRPSSIPMPLVAVPSVPIFVLALLLPLLDVHSLFALFLTIMLYILYALLVTHLEVGVLLLPWRLFDGLSVSLVENSLFTLGLMLDLRA